MLDKLKRLKRIFLNEPDINNSKIGYKTYIGKYSIINDSIIGKFCSIAPGVKIGLYNHYLYGVTTHPFVSKKEFGLTEHNYYSDDIRKSVRKPVIIGNDVWVGTNAVILRGVNIGNGAVIGAGSVVTKDVPPYAIVVGSPAKVIKHRLPKEQVDKLEHITWWNWDEDILKERIKDFYNVDLFIEKYCD